jgi:hypothetical protein
MPSSGNQDGMLAASPSSASMGTMRAGGTATKRGSLATAVEPTFGKFVDTGSGASSQLSHQYAWVDSATRISLRLRRIRRKRRTLAV